MSPRARANVIEGSGILVLALLGIWCLKDSWRQWCDPLIDSGPQWYHTWRVSLGAMPYRDFDWNYGPLSLLWNGFLFRCFGPGLMVVATSNLVVYTGIAAAAYYLFRAAWGRFAAFVTLAVFITVFSFSLLNAVGNYNYVLPYANETTHGMLVLLLTLVLAFHWIQRGTASALFWMSFGGGITALLKPEFMFATAVVGIVAVRARKPNDPSSLGWVFLGAALPTLMMTAWFACHEPIAMAFNHSAHAWHWVLGAERGPGLADQSGYLGTTATGQHLLWELEDAGVAALVIGILWLAGWAWSRSWHQSVKIIISLAALAAAWWVKLGDTFEIGPCFPALLIAVLLLILFPRREITPRRTLQLLLTIAALAMLARMALRTRINHFGFVQAALAGMVLTAFIVTEIPRWTGLTKIGRWLTQGALCMMIFICCAHVMQESDTNHFLQTQSVGSERDLFYAYNDTTDDAGSTVNWCVQTMASTKPEDSLLVLPEGLMINYLTRRTSPLPPWTRNEPAYLQLLAKARPEYVILLWGDDRDQGVPQFGDPGHPGSSIREFLESAYTLEQKHHGTKRWAFVFHRKGGT